MNPIGAPISEPFAVLAGISTLATILYFAIFIFLVVLAWRATKALEAAAKEQQDIAYSMREALHVLKSKQNKIS